MANASAIFFLELSSYEVAFAKFSSPVIIGATENLRSLQKLSIATVLTLIIQRTNIMMVPLIHRFLHHRVFCLFAFTRCCFHESISLVHKRHPPQFKLDLKNKGDGIMIDPETNTVSGEGTALSLASLEQDSCFWEITILSTEDGLGEIGVGVMRRQTVDILSQNLLENESNNDGSMEGVWLKSTLVADGDIIGLALDMSGIPMLQGYVNGVKKDDMVVKRNIRGSVYAAASLPAGSKVKFVFNENEWKFPPPSIKFEACVAATSLI